MSKVFRHRSIYVPIPKGQTSTSWARQWRTQAERSISGCIPLSDPRVPPVQFLHEAFLSQATLPSPLPGMCRAQVTAPGRSKPPCLIPSNSPGRRARSASRSRTSDRAPAQNRPSARSSSIRPAEGPRTRSRSRVSFAPNVSPNSSFASMAKAMAYHGNLPPPKGTEGLQATSIPNPDKVPSHQEQLAIIAQRNAEVLAAVFKQERKDGVPSALRHEVEAHRFSSAAWALEAQYMGKRDAIFDEWLSLMCHDARQAHREKQLVEDKAHLCHTCGQVFTDQRKLMQHRAIHEQAAIRSAAIKLFQEHRKGASEILKQQWTSCAAGHSAWLQELQHIALTFGASPRPSEVRGCDVDEPPPPRVDTTRNENLTHPEVSRSAETCPPLAQDPSNDQSMVFNLHLGPHAVGRIQVPVPANCPFQRLGEIIGATLGIPMDRICLTSGPGGIYLQSQEDFASTESIWISLSIPHHGSSYGPHVLVYDDTGHGVLQTDGHTSEGNIPFYLCRALGISPEFASA